MTYEQWVESVPELVRQDIVWTLEVYRLSLFLSDLAWDDTAKLMQDGRTRSLADQLYRAAGSPSANIEEGYSRSSSKDRVRFYEYALGSARESRGWYYKGRHVLGDEATAHRMNLCTQIIRLALRLIAQQRTVQQARRRSE